MTDFSTTSAPFRDLPSQPKRLLCEGDLWEISTSSRRFRCLVLRKDIPEILFLQETYWTSFIYRKSFEELLSLKPPSGELRRGSTVKKNFDRCLNPLLGMFQGLPSKNQTLSDLFSNVWTVDLTGKTVPKSKLS